MDRAEYRVAWDKTEICNHNRLIEWLPRLIRYAICRLFWRTPPHLCHMDFVCAQQVLTARLINNYFEDIRMSKVLYDELHISRKNFSLSEEKSIIKTIFNRNEGLKATPSKPQYVRCIQPTTQSWPHHKRLMWFRMTTSAIATNKGRFTISDRLPKSTLLKRYWCSSILAGKSQFVTLLQVLSLRSSSPLILRKSSSNLWLFLDLGLLTNCSGNSAIEIK